MSFPIVSIPRQGPIATRPRREQLWDTEGYADATAVPARLEIYRNTATYASTALGIGTAKVKGIDHNLDSRGGQLPKGQAMHVYGWALRHYANNGNTFGAAAVVVWDEIRRIRELTWASWLFSNSSVYITVPTNQIPAGCAETTGRFTTHNATTIIGEDSDAQRSNIYDVTMNGVPTELCELETFSVLVEAGGDITMPSPTQDIFVTNVFKGILFKGIQG